jgi:predicted phosphate transport protein (TIGR00153 family)
VPAGFRETRLRSAREEKFFDYFEQAARNALEAAHALREMLQLYRDPEGSWRRIEALEARGDEITHATVRKLNQTFITPIDREDVHVLASSLDDVMDAIEAAASRFVTFRIALVREEARQLSELLVQSAKQIVEAVIRLPSWEKTSPYCLEINRIENLADTIRREAIAAPFSDEAPVLEVIKWKEIIEILETATDRCENVAKVVETICVKHG